MDLTAYRPVHFDAGGDKTEGENGDERRSTGNAPAAFSAVIGDKLTTQLSACLESRIASTWTRKRRHFPRSAQVRCNGLVGRLVARFYDSRTPLLHLVNHTSHASPVATVPPSAPALEAVSPKGVKNITQFASGSLRTSASLPLWPQRKDLLPPLGMRVSPRLSAVRKYGSEKRKDRRTSLTSPIRNTLWVEKDCYGWLGKADERWIVPRFGTGENSGRRIWE